MYRDFRGGVTPLLLPGVISGIDQDVHSNAPARQTARPSSAHPFSRPPHLITVEVARDVK